MYNCQAIEINLFTRKSETATTVLTREKLVEQTLNKSDNARDHISTRCFWQTGQLAIYNVAM